MTAQGQDLVAGGGGHGEARHAADWTRLERRSLARLRPEDREAYGRAAALFPGRGRPRRGHAETIGRPEGGAEPLSVAERQAQYRARQRVVEAMAVEAGYRSPADLAAALLREPANRDRLPEVRGLAGRRDLQADVEQARVTGDDVGEAAYAVLRTAYRRWMLPQAGPTGAAPAPVTAAGSPAPWMAFTPLGPPPAGVELPAVAGAMLLVQSVDEAGEPLLGPAEPDDFEYLVRLAAGRLDCRLVLRRAEAGGFLTVFGSVPAALAAAAEIRTELAGPAPRMHFRMALHPGPLTAPLGGFPSREVHVCEALLLIAEADQVLVSEAAHRLLGRPADRSWTVRPCGPRLLPILQEEAVYELAGPPGDRPRPPDRPPLRVFERLPRLPFVALADIVSQGLRAVRSGTRLVTFFGPGGAGATRVAYQVAATLARSFSEDVHVVDLAAIVDRGRVAKAVAEVLEVRTPGLDATGPLVAHLRDRRALLVLDSCDRALMECQRLLEVLLPGCPALTVIATSMEPLSLPQERAFNLRRLSLPVSEGRTVRLVDLDSSEAGRLFTTRVRELDPGYRFGEPEAGSVAEVCRLVQGLPLAIELIAAMTAAVATPPAELARDLEDYLAQQTGVSGPALPRDRLLQLAISWRLWKLRQHAPGLERIVLVLSLFPADFDAEAAAEVCSTASWRVTAGELEDSLRALERLGLLRSIQSRERSEGAARAEPASGRRYRIHESIRLECDALRRHNERFLADIDQARARFADHFARLLADTVEEVHGPDQRRWIGRLTREIPNFRAALLWTQSHAARRETWARLAGAYARLLLRVGHTEEAERIVHDGLERWTAQDLTQLHLLSHAGLIAFRRADVQRARRLWTRAVALARDVGGPDELARALDQLGMAALGAGRYADAQRLSEEARALAGPAGDPGRAASASLHLGLVALRQGRRERARQELETSRRLWLEASRPDPGRIAASQLGLAELAIADADLPAARALLRGALSAYAEPHDRQGIASALCLCAVLATAEADPDRAVRLRAAAERIVADMGQQVPPTWQPAVSRAVDRARSELSPRALEIAEQRGADMDDQRAVEYARAHLGDPPVDPAF